MLEHTKQRTILLVDDDRLILSTLKDGLKNAGYLVDTCESVKEAEVWLENHERPDLVLLDMRMPERPGTELAKTLKEKESIPFVMLTAYGDEETTKEVNALGATSYLVKPVSIAQIIPAIETAIARAEDNKKLRYNQKMLQIALDGDRAVSVAVGIIMNRHRIGQEEAFELIRRKARSNHLKLIDVAANIIDACDVLNIHKKLSPKAI